MVSGATQNRAGKAAVERADRKRKLGELVDRVPPPPMKNKAEYNGGMGKAALSTEDWLSGLAPARQPVDIVDPVTGEVTQVPADEWATVANGYDATCGMEPFAVFARRLLKACFVEDMRRPHYGAIDYQYEPKVQIILNRLQAKRNVGYYSRLIDAPAPAVLPQQLQSAADIDLSLEELTDRDSVRIDHLVEKLETAIAHPGRAEARQLPDGFHIEEGGINWWLTHPVLPNKLVIATTPAVGSMRVSVVYRNEVASMYLKLQEANQAKKEARQNDKGPNHISTAVQLVVEQVANARESHKSVTEPVTASVTNVTGVTVAACDIHKFFDPKLPRPETGRCKGEFDGKVYSL